MSGKGFGKTQPTKIDKYIEQAMKASLNRSPESLDQIFDNLPVKINNKVLKGTIAALNQDIDTLAWLCGYFASEINSSSDNEKSNRPISLLSKVLIKHGMKPFTDFMPYIGCRLTIINTDKFESLPNKVQEVINQAFEVMESSDEDIKNVNNAMLAEFLID